VRSCFGTAEGLRNGQRINESREAFRMEPGTGGSCWLGSGGWSWVVVDHARHGRRCGRLLLREDCEVAKQAGLPCRRSRHQSRATEQKLSPGRVHGNRMPISCFNQKNSAARIWRRCAQRVNGMVAKAYFPSLSSLPFRSSLSCLTIAPVMGSRIKVRRSTSRLGRLKSKRDSMELATLSKEPPG
jgi:hypothetical protein